MNRHCKLILLIFIFLNLQIFISLSPPSAHAEVYHYVDKDGRSHFVEGIDRVPQQYRDTAITSKQFPTINRTSLISLAKEIRIAAKKTSSLSEMLNFNISLIQAISIFFAVICFFIFLFKRTKRTSLTVLSSFFLCSWTFGWLPIPASLQPSFLKSDSQDWTAKNAPMFRLHKEGDKEGALQIARQLLEEAEEKFDRLDIKRIEAVHHVGWLCYDAGKLTEAKYYLEGGLQLYLERDKLNATLPANQQQHPPGVHGVGNEYVLLGNIAAEEKNKKLAQNYYREALTYYKKGLPKHEGYYKQIEKMLEEL